MKLPSILIVIAIMVVVTALPDFGTTEAQTTSNRQECHIRIVRSPYGTEIQSESSESISIPKYDRSGVEIGRKIFLKSQFSTDSAGRRRLRPSEEPVTIFGDYKWNRGQVTRTATDVRTSRTVTETVDADRLSGLCR